jgi:hypothetical protein
VQQSKRERTSPALQAERTAGSGPFPQRFVDHEGVAVEALDRGDLALGQISEERFIEAARRLPAAARPVGPADDVVRGVGCEGGQHAGHVVVPFVSEVFVDPPIHLLRGQLHGGNF